MHDSAIFWITMTAIIWVGWPLWQIASDLRKLREKANA